MEPRLFFYVNLVLSAIVFLEVLFTFRKNSFLKVYFLLIIGSLFAMNYFACTGVTTRLRFIVAISMRIVYVVSTILAIIHLVNAKIPRWFILLIVFSVPIMIGTRVYYYDQIDIEKLSQLPNPVFSVGSELYTPKLGARYTIFALAITAIIITYYYYRQFLMRINRESPYYKQITRWIISLVIPFFLLTIFSILGNLGMFSQMVSSYLFSFFNCIILFSFLLRPRIMNTRSYPDINNMTNLGVSIK
jgi:uncharacterized membrane protein YfcA